MVIPSSLSASYVINGDGSQRFDVQLTAPAVDNSDLYVKSARSAVVMGQLYFFGGNGIDDTRKKVSLFLFFSN